MDPLIPCIAIRFTSFNCQWSFNNDQLLCCILYHFFKHGVRKRFLVKKKSPEWIETLKFYELQNTTKPRLLLENKSKNRNLARYFVMPCLKNLKEQIYQLNRYKQILKRWFWSSWRNINILLHLTIWKSRFYDSKKSWTCSIFKCPDHPDKILWISIFVRCLLRISYVSVKYLRNF